MAGSRELAIQIDEFQALVNLGRAELEQAYGGGQWPRLSEFFGAQLRGADVPAPASASEFADTVQLLGENRKAWGQRLGSIVIDLHDEELAARAAGAKQALEEFIRQCPWAYLRESAQEMRRVSSTF